MADLLRGTKTKGSSNVNRVVAEKKPKGKNKAPGYGIFANEHVPITFEVKEVEDEDLKKEKEEKKKTRERFGSRKKGGRPVLRKKQPEGGEGREDKKGKKTTETPKVKFQDENATGADANNCMPPPAPPAEERPAMGDAGLSFDPSSHRNSKSGKKKEMKVPKMTPEARTSLEGAVRASRIRAKMGRSARHPAPSYAKWSTDSRPVDRTLLTIDTDVNVAGGAPKEAKGRIPDGGDYSPVKWRPVSAGKFRAVRLGGGGNGGVFGGGGEDSPKKSRRPQSAHVNYRKREKERVRRVLKGMDKVRSGAKRRVGGLALSYRIALGSERAAFARFTSLLVSASYKLTIRSSLFNPRPPASVECLCDA